MSKALIIVDMQNDFLLSEGSLNLGHDTKKLRENIADLVKTFEGPLYFTADRHNNDDCEFETFPKHCLDLTQGCKLVSEIIEALKGKTNCFFLRKKSFTGEEITDLANELARKKIKEIHVVGVCTHICVHDVIATLVNQTKDTHNYIPQIFIHGELIDDFDQEMANFSLKRMQKIYGVKII